MKTDAQQYYKTKHLEEDKKKSEAALKRIREILGERKEDKIKPK